MLFRKGIRRDAIMYGGKYEDDILMAMLEDEWKQMAMPCMQPRAWCPASVQRTSSARALVVVRHKAA